MFEHLQEDWWWTVTRRACRCHVCSELIPQSGVIAFNSNGGSVYCEQCADTLGVSVECRRLPKESGLMLGLLRQPGGFEGFLVMRLMHRWLDQHQHRLGLSAGQLGDGALHGLSLRHTSVRCDEDVRAEEVLSRSRVVRGRDGERQIAALDRV